MKPMISISFLSLVAFSIIVFWLVPRVNTSKETTYVRRYEDTDTIVKDRKASDTTRAKRATRRTQDETAKKTGKVYKTEKISSHNKLSELKASMFSRAIHFKEIPNDSIGLVVEDALIKVIDTAATASGKP